ncbi:dTDP-4-dehydrorhamnose 3,5-epimerase [Phyllobacterium phragmitis]|uniref:dTDP-4-dehydrorhamnose 3,5-epimerase n=1 Tax=Phyllobacterium phragmitis TaxID=2670329 RepID=A0A2S9IM73_9HYPH|nr:polysaccharide pyruvyl transferase family protein [Phyllobacterium phragmitis]PRD41624.1 dTDP-4-dehydrorhamnose 3,5-epimerase [Phyllobacterium phragmitis]
MRIGLFGQFGSGNSGNDGSLEAMLAFLRRTVPDAELLCICPRPDVVRRQYRLEAVAISGDQPQNRLLRLADTTFKQMPRRIGDFFAAIRIARKLDLIIIPGTGILDDFCESPLGWPYVIFRWCLAARLGGAKLAFVSIGAGPIRHPLSRIFMKSAARMACYRSYRDQPSYSFMKGIGLDVARDRVYGDLAFGLPVPEESRLSTASVMTVGVGVMAYSGWKKEGSDGEAIYRAYLQKMSDFVAWLLAQGMAVRLLTGGVVDRQAIGDLLAIVNSGPENGASCKIVAEEMSSLHDLMRQIVQTDLVVATRYHNVICALSTGRPAISLGYAEKNDELLIRTGLAEFCHHVETFDTEALEMQFSSMLERYQELKHKVRYGVETFRAQLMEQEDLLRDKLMGLPVNNRGAA